MKRKIVIIVSVIVLSFLIIWFVISTLFSKTLTCIKENDGPLENWYYEYSFTGYGRVVKSRERYSKIKDNDRHETIDKYYEMLKDDKDVYDIKIIDNTIEWHSKTSMVNYENLDNCKDEDGNIIFSKVKQFYEESGYVCKYS